MLVLVFMLCFTVLFASPYIFLSEGKSMECQFRMSLCFTFQHILANHSPSSDPFGPVLNLCTYGVELRLVKSCCISQKIVVVTTT